MNWHLSYNRYGNNLRFFAYNHDMTMWINGIQIEKGDETTEFLDDTMRIVEQLRQGK